jgi:hypothetical protein
MTRTRDDDQRSVPALAGFRHQRRPLVAGETLPPKVDLVAQIIALSDRKKRMRAQTSPDLEQRADAQDEESLDADA